MSSPLLQVNNLHLTLKTPTISLKILHGVSFDIYPGEIVGLVGESGSGKSLTASAILGLLPPSHELLGSICFEGREVTQSPHLLSSLRGNRISLILQDPALALNPVIPIGAQLIEGICYHKKLSKRDALAIGIEWLARVGIGDASYRMRQYPHELSGGMKQRILIAMALMCQSSLLLADEPTTALDVTVQAQILDLLLQLQHEEQTSILLITHDLGVVARCCQRILVMYAGQLVETGPVERVLTIPQHPYTQALLQSRGSLERPCDKSLFCLEGYPPLLHQKRTGCAFAPRCPAAMSICKRCPPPLEMVNHEMLRCWLPQSMLEKEEP